MTLEEDVNEPQATITITGDSIAVLTELGNILRERAIFAVHVSDSLGMQVFNTPEGLFARAKQLSELKEMMQGVSENNSSEFRVELDSIVKALRRKELES